MTAPTHLRLRYGRKIVAVLLTAATACGSGERASRENAPPDAELRGLLDSAASSSSRQLASYRQIVVRKCKSELASHANDGAKRERLARLTTWTVAWSNAPVGPVAYVVGTGQRVASLSCNVPVINGEAMVTGYSPF
jgi:hypothetical protein